MLRKLIHGDVFSRNKITKQNCLFMILSVSVIKEWKKFKFIISQPRRDTRAPRDVVFWYRFRNGNMEELEREKFNIFG